MKQKNFHRFSNSLFIVAVILSLAGFPIKAFPASGLTAGYAFDEASGTTATDASGNNLNGTLVNGPTWALGKYGNAVNLDGSNDYVNLGNPTALRITGSMTISAWINSDKFPYDDAAIVSKRTGGSSGFQLDTTIDQGPRAIGFKLTDSSNADMIRYGATAMQTNTWYHVAGVYNAAARTIDVYLNGQLDNGPRIGTITSSQINSSQNVNVGRRPGAAGFEFSGRVDDVRIYDRALTQAEIQSDMNASLGLPSDITPPVISAVNATAIATSSATITWTTNESADSQVEYGTSLSYGQNTTLNSTLVTNHSSSLAGLTASTPYHYRVKSRDAAGNLTTSGDFTFTTAAPVNQAPVVNAGLDQVIALPGLAGLSGTASDDGLPNPPSSLSFVWTVVSGPGTVIFGNANTASTSASFSQAGTYILRFTASDSVLSASDDVVVTVNAPDTTPPSTPFGLSAIAVSASQINLSWTASTDNIAVTGYRIERCQGFGCTTFNQIGVPSTNSYSDTGLSANTPYSYRVLASDAAGNLSGYSSIANATTLAATAGITIGETQILSLSDNGNANLLVAQQATLSQPATIQSLSFYVTSAAGNLRLGIYDATGPNGGPGAKKAETAEITAVVGWNTATVITPVLLPAGIYYLAYLPNNNDLYFVKTTSGPTSYFYPYTYGTMPATFSTSPFATLSHWSLYATLTASGVFDTAPPQVSITFPQNNSQVSNIIIVTADATDNVGVVGVQFLVDGVSVGVEDTNPPFGLAWDTRTVTNGAHVLTARASDLSGNTTLSTPINVNVANTNFFQNEILATGFNLPTNIEFLPDGRMLVAELQGTIKILPSPYTQPDPTPFLQITNIGSAGVQQGIYDIVLDPDFTNNHFYYVFYTAGTPNHDRLSRFTADASLTGTVPGSELVLYEDPQNANAEHHGGAVNFGNDGKIYFTTGDHFNGGDSQLLSSPRGKIHRINKDGTIPTDNPFYDGAGPNWDSIWALGLRNPFRAYYDAPTGRLIVGDVGGNDYSVAKEEVNLGIAGANYGWPDSEGPCSAPCVSPIYFYPHNGRDAAVTGGFVYHGTQFPSSYQGSYFFADYTQNWIRRLTFDASGNVSGIFNFEPADGSVDGPYGDIVYLAEGPDGALYYVDLGYSDISGTFGVSKIRRIRYTQSNQAPVAIASANPTSGSTPLTVNFSSAGSLDPEGQPITYLWTFGDGTTSTAANPSHVYTLPGQYTVRLTVSDGVNSTLAIPLFISAGSKPTATILSPQDGAFFIAGDTIFFSGDATDTKDGTLPASAFTWNIDFLHESHVHPGTPITGIKSGSFIIPTSGHDFSGNTRYRIMLTATNSVGLQSSQFVIVYPNKVNLSFDTAPTGLTLYLDGIARLVPSIYDTLVGFNHTIEARNQSVGTTTYTFTSWSDGGAQQHVIVVPTANQSYVASYTAIQNLLPLGLVAGWSLNEGTGISAGDASGNVNTLTLANGATWANGKYNGGLSLNGSTNAYALDSASLDLSSSYTLTAWVNPATLNNYQTVLIKEGASGGCGYWLQITNNQISSGFNGGGGCLEHTASANLQTGIWYHLAVVFDDIANTYNIYLNGNLLSSQSETSAPVPNNQNLTIGQTAYGENWNGLLDEVRIYNRALNANEIQTDMNTPLP